MTMKQSKTQKALALVDAGLSAYAAAKQVGLSNPVVYKAIAARKNKLARPVCPTCHRPLKSKPGKE